MILIMCLTLCLCSISSLEAQDFKRFKLELIDGTIIKGKNAQIFSDSLTFGDQSILLSRINTLSYSNTHSGDKGSAWGSVVGLVVPVYLAIIAVNERKNYSNSEMPINTVPFILLAAVVTVGTGAGVGYLIGSRYYTDWQDYPLRSGTRYISSLIRYTHSVSFDPHDKIFRIKWNFSLNKFRSQVKDK